MVRTVLERTPRVLAVYCGLFWKRFWEYRFNAWFDVIIRVVEFFTYFLFWNTILSQTNQSFQGWGFQEFVLLFALQSFFVGFVVSFGYSAIRISNEIMRGKFDQQLCRPSFSWLSAWMHNGDLNIMNFIMGFLALGYLVMSGYYIDPTKFFMIIPMVLITFLIVGLFGLCLGSLTFWLGRTNGTDVLFDSFWQFCDYPATIYNPFLQSLLAFTFPFLFIHTVPIQWISGQISIELFVQYFLIELAVLWTMMILFYLLWKKGVKHYEGFGG